MDNNDILRRLRYIFDLNDAAMITTFSAAGCSISKEQVTGWLLREDADSFMKCNDTVLALFLDGLINEKRGKREGPQPPPEKRINNNIILRKLKIALNYTDKDVLNTLSLADFNLGKSELSAFFRKTSHKHYRDCKDQVLRNFLQGLQIELRDGSGRRTGTPWKK